MKTFAEVNLLHEPFPALSGDCGDCRHWERANDSAASGQCRRRAPVAAADGSAVFPITREDDYCGDFEA